GGTPNQSAQFTPAPQYGGVRPATSGSAPSAAMQTPVHNMYTTGGYTGSAPSLTNSRYAYSPTNFGYQGSSQSSMYNPTFAQNLAMLPRRNAGGSPGSQGK
ncbi:MAG TPA: hypothetical protein VLA24_06015, partial [Pseudomonadales bacterium]|nr:hypothetical protein [Pseudomonadales bacterium]